MGDVGHGDRTGDGCHMGIGMGMGMGSVFGVCVYREFDFRGDVGWFCGLVYRLSSFSFPNSS